MFEGRLSIHAGQSLRRFQLRFWGLNSASFLQKIACAITGIMLYYSLMQIPIIMCAASAFSGERQQEVNCNERQCAKNLTPTPPASTRRMANLAIFTAVIIVLQVNQQLHQARSRVHHAGPGALLSSAPRCTARPRARISDGVMGILCLFLTGLFGWDGGFVLYLMSQNAWATVAHLPSEDRGRRLWLAGLVYQGSVQKEASSPAWSSPALSVP
jgi:hypothetical protein